MAVAGEIKLDGGGRDFVLAVLEFRMMTLSPRSGFSFLVILCVCSAARAAGPTASGATRELEGKVLAVFKSRCVKCHGPAKPKAGLELMSLEGVARGGENGPVVLPGDLEESVLWLNITEGTMPPDRPLPEAEQALIRRWIEAGSPGLTKRAGGASEGSGHWAFRALSRPQAPPVEGPARVRTEVDRFLQSALRAEGLAPGPDADGDTLIRRVSLDLTGLPPTPGEILEFRADASPDAYERMVDRFLASPHYGERWGKHWLDAAGYADSNGYFSADTDRPLAYRYRDYVVRSFNADKPLDQLVREQLAGDEMSGYRPGQAASPGMIDLVEATHYLRNGQDGTDDSVPDNPEAQQIDRYAALEAIVQITANSMLGLTIQCARCHDHKFEPITQREYYQLQAIFYPAFNPKDWIKPKDRFVFAYLPGEKEEWDVRTKRIDAEVAVLRRGFRRWVAQERPRGVVRFDERFEPPDAPLSSVWSSTAPGDDAPGGPIEVDSANAPGATRKDGTFRVAAGQGDSWVSTREAIDWTPGRKGDWVQATFELVDTKLEEGGIPAERIGYVIAAHDFDDSGKVGGGNILVDGNPGGPTSVHLDYPGKDSKPLSPIGKKGYEPGHNYGVRITNIGGGRFRLEHLVDWSVEGKSLVLKADDLPDGGFAFFAALGRSFVVDDVLVESNDPAHDRPRGLVRLEADFETPDAKLEGGWSATAPGDDKPAGGGVMVDSRMPPGALVKDGRLQVIVRGADEGWLSTKEAIDWTPDGPGRSVQVTFDLVDDRLGEEGSPAERIGYYIAAHDFDDSGTVRGGNILIDGNPGGPTSLYLDYPGKDARVVGPIGKIGYVPGRNYGVRVTNLGKGVFRLEHLVDGRPEGGGLALSEGDLPDGGFGFYLGAGRSYVVDNVVIEGDPPSSEGEEAEESSFVLRLRAEGDQLAEAVKDKLSGRTEGPGRKIAWMSDRSAQPPEVPLLKRGNYTSPGPAVDPGGLAVLTDPGHEMAVEAPEGGSPTTGRRLALARWLTEPGSRPAALLARVQANRIWQEHFGVGLVPTSENLGLSGAPPSHPELLEYLASELVRSGWGAKALHRLILGSTAYRQSSRNRAEAFRVDPDNRLLWRHPLRRLDAETIRDAMLAVSGGLDAVQGGAYIPTRQSAVGEVVVEEEAPGARRRSIYLQQRRSQTLSMLKVFDAPSIAFICSARSPSTIPLQSLSQLNSEFALARARGMARRVEAEAGPDGGATIRRAFLIAAGRDPSAKELAAAERFLNEHPDRSPSAGGSSGRPLTDFCQMLLASNAFLYVE